VVLENRTGWHKKVEDSGIGERRRTDGWYGGGRADGAWLAYDSTTPAAARSSELQ